MKTAGYVTLTRKPFDIGTVKFEEDSMEFDDYNKQVNLRVENIEGDAYFISFDYDLVGELTDRTNAYNARKVAEFDAVSEGTLRYHDEQVASGKQQCSDPRHKALATRQALVR